MTSDDLAALHAKVTSTRVGLHGRVVFHPGDAGSRPLVERLGGTRAWLAWPESIMGKGLDMARRARRAGLVAW